MAKKEKAFNFKLYGIVTFIVIAAALVLICVTTFKAKYTAFHPDELAKTYVDTIVQTGDGYNAYKNTLASKNMKYGDFIRKYYINPIIYRDCDYTVGDSTEGLKGYNDESYIGEATASDDGTLNGKLIQQMYPVYEVLVENCSYDEYDAFYQGYIHKLIAVREEIFGDKYFSDEVFFTAFEANVAMYADKLTGTQDKFDENTGVQLSYKSTGVYQQLYGEDYKFTVSVVRDIPMDLGDYKSQANEEMLFTYGVSREEVSQARLITLEVRNQKGELVTSTEVVTAKIGMSWYVDNTITQTDSLYSFY